jgi:F-type H+-transporting ATPase subunit b
MKAITQRQARIAEGLSAAERSVHELELAQHKSAEVLRDAKIQAADILDQANKRANRIIDESKERARQEGERLLTLAKSDIVQEIQAAKQQLHVYVGEMAVAGAEKILRQHIDAKTNAHLVEQFIGEM